MSQPVPTPKPASEGRSIRKLLFGTGAGQAVAILCAPFLTRIYTPADFGVFAVYSSFLGLFLVIASLRYELTIPMAKTEQEAVNLLGLSAALAALMAGMVFVLTPFLLEMWAMLQVDPAGKGAPAGRITDRVPWFAAIVSLGVLIAGWSRVINYWGIRKQAYGVIGQMKAWQGVGGVALQLLLGWLGFRSAGLLIGDALGRGLGCARLGASLAHDMREGGLRMGWKGIRDGAIQFKDFAIYSAPAALLNSGGLLAAPILVTLLYGLEAGGLFALAQRIAGMPISLLSQAFADVYTGSLTKLRRAGDADLEALHRRFAKKLTGIALLAMIAMWCVPTALITLVFGEEWSGATAYIRLISIMCFGQLVAAPLSQTLLILNRHRWQVTWDTARFVLALGTIIASHAMGMSAVGAVGVFAVSMALMYFVLLWLTALALRRDAAGQSAPVSV